jgi:hypothetical protein
MSFHFSTVCFEQGCQHSSVPPSIGLESFDGQICETELVHLLGRT